VVAHCMTVASVPVTEATCAPKPSRLANTSGTPAASRQASSGLGVSSYGLPSGGQQVGSVQTYERPVPLARRPQDSRYGDAVLDGLVPKLSGEWRDAIFRHVPTTEAPEHSSEVSTLTAFSALDSVRRTVADRCNGNRWVSLPRFDDQDVRHSGSGSTHLGIRIRRLTHDAAPPSPATRTARPMVCSRIPPRRGRAVQCCTFPRR
jgi:hypothetical protein